MEVLIWKSFVNYINPFHRIFDFLIDEFLNLEIS